MRIGFLLIVATVIIHSGIALKCYTCHFSWKHPLDDGSDFTDKYYDPAVYHSDCAKAEPPKTLLHECPSNSTMKSEKFTSFCATHYVFGSVQGILRDCETVSIKPKGKSTEHQITMNVCENSTKLGLEDVQETECRCNKDGCIGSKALKSNNKPWVFNFINVLVQLMLLKIITSDLQP